MRKLKILLADDHETVREGLKVIVNAQSDMEVIAEVADGQSAVTQAVSLQPDVVVMDISMPRLNGLQAMEQIRQANPRIRVLTLTRHRDDGYLRQLLRAGASGYVLKQSRASELLQAIRAVGTGGKYIDPALTDKVVAELARKAPPAAPGPDPAISGREEEILRLVAWGYSNKEIAAKLDLSVKTVETHKANAAQKLGLRTRVDIVRFALLRGWLRDS